jgi:lipopolysaccharide transport system ATP-binding protein
MSSEVLISASGLSKRYDLYDKPHHRLLELIGGVSRAKAFWAVQDVGLEIRRGETVGIVGRNGSGKSTLLQMICGTLEPTAGELTVNGRVSALLELGAGFNPEFTGMENVYLNASLMGLSRSELDGHMDALLAFADIGPFLHQPVRTYSSGMYVRLAFAVAIAVEPDILVVDEALAVGDEAFQRKCFARIEQMRERGTAILFVSHSAGSVVQLCDRAMLMEGGRKLLEGSPKAVVGHYQKLIYAPSERVEAVRADIAALGATGAIEAVDDAGVFADRATQPAVRPLSADEAFEPGFASQSMLEYESRGARILDTHLVNERGERVNVLVVGRRYRYRYTVEFSQDARMVHFGMMLKSLGGIELFGMGSHAHGDGLPTVEAGSRVQVEFTLRLDLLPGTYFFNAGVSADHEDGHGFLHRIVDALMVRVDVARTDRRYAGVVDLSGDADCKLSRTPPEARVHG